MDIFLYEVVFEVVADDAQTGGELLEQALKNISNPAVLDYDISEEVTRVVHTAQ